MRQTKPKTPKIKLQVDISQDEYTYFRIYTDLMLKQGKITTNSDYAMLKHLVENIVNHVKGMKNG